MNKIAKIVKIKGRQIIDSRGTPTVEAEVVVRLGNEYYKGMGQAPSGASTGKFEAIELRDKDKAYNGKGVLLAVKNINERIFPELEGLNGFNQKKIDNKMIRLDGNENKGKLGANAILAVSIANAKACANAMGIELYRYFGGIYGTKMPMPMMNILNGGAHADNNVDVQEFMIVPIGAKNFATGLRWCCEVYGVLKEILKERSLSTTVGDEGGFAPNISGEIEGLKIIMSAFEKAGFEPGKDFMISLDVAASEWKSDEIGEYKMPKKKKRLTREELIDMWVDIVNEYPIFSIEDPLDEEDFQGWSMITKKLGDKIKLVGDDLFVTNEKKLKKGICEGYGNAILVKPNQIGTITETMDTVNLAAKHGFITILSHRSGETEDTTIADLAVGLNAGYIKTGAPCRGERTAKYNRLLRIEEKI